MQQTGTSANMRESLSKRQRAKQFKGFCGQLLRKGQIGDTDQTKVQHQFDLLIFVHTIIVIRITYDPIKNSSNMELHGINFDQAIAFDFRQRWYSLKQSGESGSLASARQTIARYVDMNKQHNPELVEQENPEWTAEETRAALPFAGLPTSLQAKLRGRPKAAVTKERITIRLSPDVVQSFRETGDGWQTRVDLALRDWLKTHSPTQGN